MSRSISSAPVADVITVEAVPTKDPLVISPIEFIGLFTPAEELGIREFADGTDLPHKIVKVWLGRLDDVRVSTVDLSKQSVRQGVLDMVGLGLLTPERADEILLGAI